MLHLILATVIVYMAHEMPFSCVIDGSPPINDVRTKESGVGGLT